ncbi:hypothetical protein [Seleniivibrio sp.]|uniref:hypothetical protein n=1 Tax=Seleniivibrio sp. TaxID=2898801 RepID=UPI0025D5D619|nr:hypothetical protein [Seleniivibrio sp.]MCD8552689.1 hypothetical protein [Seleniivibrio sp.]
MTIKISFIAIMMMLYAWAAQAAQKDPEIPSVAGCSIIAERSGRTALTEIAYLHRKQIDAKDAYSAEYKCADGSVYVWASFSENNLKAQQLYKDMDVRMPQSKVFSDMKRMNINGIGVTQVQGMGMDNYYFLKDTGNYWVAVKDADSMKYLKAFMRSIK